MKRSAANRGFTLTELMAVLTLAAIGISVVTVNTHTLSDAARFRSVASQIGSVYRLALYEAMRTGLPRSIVLQPGRCAVQKPVFNEGIWTWSEPAIFDFAPGVKLVDVRQGSASSRQPQDRGSWHVLVRPGFSNRDIELRLRTPAGGNTVALIDAISGTGSFRESSDD